ncbi:hypothetical protein SteCoe_27335 [Stentor coeruleus]|uniref:Importin N-terminal domain-containing protein n=1 Tax=Stentor coeruleus TaxID=5963 RepID=A0A1R2BAV5_9CILI|nr:hypothetical protein SteCoe_27335 [Stentor coeruleus]
MEQLFDILSKCISNPQYLSRAGEILKEYENAEGYAPALVLIINDKPQKPIQTLAAIILKNFITDHWDETTQADKAKTKQGVLSLLYVNDSMLRNLIALSLAGIIHHEFPDSWPRCFMELTGLLQNKSIENVMVVINAFSLIFQECDDRLSRALPTLVPVLLEVYRGYSQEFLREKVIEVLGLCLESLSWADGIEQDLVEKSLNPTWWSWSSIFSESINSPTVSLETKQHILKLLTCFYRDFSQTSQPWVAGMIPIVWILMYNLIPSYVENTVFNRETISSDLLEDIPCGIEGLSAQLLELLSCVVIRPIKNESITKELQNFVGALLWYMLLTTDQQKLWKNEPNQFIAEDDIDEGWKSARLASLKLVSDIIEIHGDRAVDAILQTLSNVLTNLNTGTINLLASNYPEMQEIVQSLNSQLNNICKHYSTQYLWKMREVTVLVIGSLSKDILLFNTKAKKKGSIQISIATVLYNVILKDLDNSKDMLKGRALWCIGKISDLLEKNSCVDIFIEVCKSIRSKSVAVKLSACYAVYKLSQKISTADISDVLTNVLFGLVNLLEEVNSDTLHIVLDTLLQVSRLNEEATGKIIEYGAPVVLKVFIKNFGENVLNSKIMALLRCWCDLGKFITPLVEAFYPLVMNLISAYPHREKVTSFSSNSTIETKAGNEAIMILPNTLEIMTLFLKKSQSFSKERMYLVDILPSLLDLLGKNDDPAVLLHGTALLRAYANFADQEILQKGLVDKMIESTLTLLDPYKNEAGALNLGYFIVNIFSKLSPQIDQDLLIGCMNKLYRCKMPSVVQGFVLVFARLIHSYSSEIIGFLNNLTVERRVALKVLLDKWLIHQPLIRGRYSKNCTITALSRLFILKDPGIESLLVVGYNPSHSNVGSEVIAPLKILCTLIRCLDNESFIPKRKAPDLGTNEEFNTVIEGSGLGVVGEIEDPGDRMDTIEDDVRSEGENDPMESLKSDLIKEIKEVYDANDFKIPVSKDKGLGDYETGSECLMSDMLEFDYEDADDLGEDFHEDDLYGLQDWYGSINLQSFLLDFFNNLITNDKEYLIRCVKHLLPEDIALFRKHFTF